jgi:polar amino acid transport system substrate-binding protein
MQALPLLLLVSGLLFAHGAGAAPLRLCFEDVPQFPWTMPNGTGLNFDMLRRVEKLTGEQFVFVARPWKRCMEETKAGLMDGMIGAADSPARRIFAVPPLTAAGQPDAARAMYQDRVFVFLRKGSGASWDGLRMNNPANVVVAQRGYYVADLLRAQGYEVLDTAKSAEDGLRTLAAGTADAAVLQGHDAHDMVRQDPRFKGKITVSEKPFVVFDFHLMFGRKTHARQHKRLEAIWNAIAVVRADPAYQKLEADSAR